MNINGINVVNEDVFNLIPTIDDNSLDLVLTDPPYLSDTGGGYGKNNKKIMNDSSLKKGEVDINYRFLKAIKPKMKDDTSLYIFTNHNYFDRIKKYGVDLGYNYRATIILVKNNFGMGYGFRNQYEICVVLEKGKAKYNHKNFSNVIQMKHVQHEDDSHPHRKDYDVMRKIILHSSQEGDLVFDGFVGSFVTPIACYREKRRFIGSELDKRWFDKYQRELEAEMNQLTMF